jgi:hypothetical protein
MFNLPHGKELKYLSEQIFMSLGMRARNMWNFLSDLTVLPHLGSKIVVLLLVSFTIM